MALGQIRLQFQGPALAGDRLVHVSQVLERIAQVPVHLGAVGNKFQSSAIAGDRGVELSLIFERSAQVIVSFGKILSQFHGPAVARDGVVQLALDLESHAQAVVISCIGAIRRDCPCHVLDSNLRLAKLLSHPAEMTKRIGLMRLDRENLPIDLLGSLQAARLMVLESDRHCFGKRCHKV